MDIESMSKLMHSIREKLVASADPTADDFVTLHFHALPEPCQCYTFDAESIAAYESFNDFFEDVVELDAEELAVINERDIETIEWSGTLPNAVSGRTFDWEEYRRALDVAQSMREPDAGDIIAAAIRCDVALDNIREVYVGRFDSDGDYAEYYFQDDQALEEMPSIFRNNINWGDVAIDISTEFVSDNHYYFRTY